MYVVVEYLLTFLHSVKFCRKCNVVLTCALRQRVAEESSEKAK